MNRNTEKSSKETDESGWTVRKVIRKDSQNTFFIKSQKGEVVMQSHDRSRLEGSRHIEVQFHFALKLVNFCYSFFFRLLLGNMIRYFLMLNFALHMSVAFI